MKVESIHSIKMSTFQTINGDRVCAITKVDFKVFRCARNYFEGAIIWSLQRFLYCIVTDEDMSTRL